MEIPWIVDTSPPEAGIALEINKLDYQSVLPTKFCKTQSKWIYLFNKR